MSVLERPALVLNRNWQAIGVATVARSLVKVWSDSARIVDPQDFQCYDWADWAALTPDADELCIRTQSLRLRVPEVITLNHYDRMPKKAVAFSRRNIFKRDNFECQYCGVQGRAGNSRRGRADRPELTIDHVVPRSHGGTSTWENCVLACMRCNSMKADRTPDQASMPLRKAPVRPMWRPLYASHNVRIDSWSKFISEAYWNASLEE